MLVIALIFEISYITFWNTASLNLNNENAKEIVLDLSGVMLKEVELGEKEQSFFDRRKVQFAKNYFSGSFNFFNPSVRFFANFV